MWKFAAAQAIGTSHLKANLSCQDRLSCDVLPGNILISVVADGAGSASNAERGAEIAVNSVTAHLIHGIAQERTDFDHLLHEAAVKARTAVIAAADLDQLSLREYASTLLAVVLTPKGGSALQIGDGVIVASDGHDEWSWVFWPQRGEYANTTHFLTDDDAISRLEIETLPCHVTDIALMSDGLEPLVLHYATKTVHDPFFRSIFRPLLAASASAEIASLSTALQAFLSSERVASRTDDDVSLVIATRRQHQDHL